MPTQVFKDDKAAYKVHKCLLVGGWHLTYLDKHLVYDCRCYSIHPWKKHSSLHQSSTRFHIRHLAGNSPKRQHPPASFYPRHRAQPGKRQAI